MSEHTNRLGVHLVGLECHRLGWLFREQPTSDQGIDAHVEKADGDVGTGRLLALQIKTEGEGDSYFNEPTVYGWVFRFNAKKARLWLGHALPVLVVLVDLDGEAAYWQRISSHTVVSTGRGFKVGVPRSHRLSYADAEWTHIASGLEFRALERYDLSITQLPPSVRRALAERPATERPDAAVLAIHLAEGRDNPRGTTQALLATSPGWIERNVAWAWQVVASFAAEHDLLDLSAEALQRAAAAIPERLGRLLAVAALHLVDIDRPRSKELLAQAEATGLASIVDAVVKALLEHPEGDAGPRRLDPSLLSGSEAVRGSQIAQSLLSDHAARSGDLDAACEHARLAHEADPDNSGVMATHAVALVRRANSTRQRLDDLPTAIQLLEHALLQRRSWSGPTVGVLVLLVQAYALNGQFDTMLKQCLPSPEGSASPEEAADPRIRRHALYAAHLAGRRDLVEAVAESLGESVQDRIAKLRTRTLDLTRDEQLALWDEELTRAIADNDYEAVANSAVVLASFGQDERPRLAPFVERSIIPASYLDLVTALVAAMISLDAALPELRTLARRDTGAAEYLIIKLTEAGRYLEAAHTYSALFEASRNPYFLIGRAQCLLDGSEEGAEAAALEAVHSTSEFPADRARLFAYLGAQAARRGEWDTAERHLAEVLRLSARPAPEDVWRVVAAQLNQGRLRRAANTVAQYQPTVTNPDEAQLWLQANAAIVWDEARASEALTLARRFKGTPRLSAALLGEIVTRTQGIRDGAEPQTPPGGEADEHARLEARRSAAQGTVPAELHRQAFAAMDELVAEFGDASGVTVLRGEPEQLLEQTVSLLQATAASAGAFRDLIDAARDARVPRGFVASVRARSYATLLVQRTLGALVSAPADDDEHLLDVQAAHRAIGRSVVVDAATLLVLTGISSPTRLEGQFPALLLPAVAMRDIHRAAFDIRGLAGSPGTVTWDPQLGSVAFHELGELEFTRQLRRVQALEDIAEGLPVRTVGTLTLFDRLGAEPQNAPWLHPIQLAHDEGVALWSDDLGLRRLARQLGVQCFGTSALIDALRDRALEIATTDDARDAALLQTASYNRELAHDLVVDVALHLEDLLYLAEQEAWLPDAAGAVISRAAWWAWQVAPVQDLLTLYAKIAAHRPDSLPAWQYAAMVGAARAFQPANFAAKMLAALALLGYDGEPSIGGTVQGLNRARQIADELHLPDPLAQLPAAASVLARSGGSTELELIVSAVIDEFQGDHD